MASPQRVLQQNLRRIADRRCKVHPPYGRSVKVTGPVAAVQKTVANATAAGIKPVAVGFVPEPYARWQV
jgi:hypothetical protein